jgi:glycosyltransferase involved in cell wall biosynthesis
MNVGTIYTLFNRRAGAELHTEMVIVGLPKKFPDVRFTIFCNKNAFDVLPCNLNINKIYIPLLDNQYSKVFWLLFLSKKQIKAFDLDLFWIFSGTNYFPLNYGVKNVVQFLDFGEYFVKKKYDFFRTFFRKHISIPLSLKFGNFFISISNATKNDLIKLFNINSIVVYPGTSPRIAYSILGHKLNSAEIEILNKFNKIIFTPGRIDYYGKGLDVLIKAYYLSSKINNKLPPLVLVGSLGEASELFFEDIKKYSLEDRVFWLGRVSDQLVDALYSISDFVIISSRYEGFGFPILEAMSHSVPIISSDAGSLSEVADDAALIFPSGDSNFLSDHINILFDSNELKEDLISKGRDRLNLFSWDNNFNNLYNIFKANI